MRCSKGLASMQRLLRCREAGPTSQRKLCQLYFGCIIFVDPGQSQAFTDVLTWKRNHLNFTSKAVAAGSPALGGRCLGLMTSNPSNPSSEHCSSDPPTRPPWSDQGSRFTFGVLKDLVSQAVGPSKDLVALHGGLPPPECFPLTSLTVTLSDGTKLDVPANLAQQQYNISPTGYPKLRDWCAEHTKRMHGTTSHSTIITDGNTHALEILTSLFLNPGDTLLVEAYTYPHFLDCIAKVKGYNVVPIPVDTEGIVPKELERLLSQQQDVADSSEKKKRPKVLYTVPFGQNPTGATTPLERKRKIYNTCRTHGVYILEDDPYAYLQFPADPCHPVPGLDGLHIDSYLSLDTDGEFVCRLDSFAKSLAPGFRLGWASAGAAVAEKLAMGIQGHTVGANMMSQAIVAEMLDTWGDAGLHKHLQKVQTVYMGRARALVEAAQRELEGLATWAQPSCGMFLWLELLHVEDSAALLPAFREAGVVVVPGRCAAAGQQMGKPCPFVRVSFSHSSFDDLAEGMRRVRKVLEERKAAT